MVVKVSNPVSEIAGAIKAGFQLLTSYKKDRHVRKLRAAVDSAEGYIRCSEEEGEFKGISVKRKAQRLRTFRKRFFKNNQG